MRKAQILALTLAVVFAASAAAQQSESNLFSLDDCVKLALKNNPTLRNARRNVNLAETNVVTARSGILPRLNSSFSFGKYISGPRVRLMDVPVGIDPITRAIKYEQREIVQASVERNSYGARLSLTQTIFDFGQSWFRISQARANAVAAEDEYRNTEQSVILDVRQKYFELLKAEKLVDVYQKAVEAAQRQLERTEAMYELGSVAQADVYKARVNLGQSKINLINQKNLVEISKANLNTVLGRDPTEPIEIMDFVPKETAPPYSFEEAARIALENNPELRSLENKVQATRVGVRIAKTNFMPSLGLSVSYNRDNEFFDKVFTTKLQNDYNVVMGLSLSFNLFNGLADKADLDRQYTNYRIAEENLENRKRTLLAEVKRAYINLQAYEEIAQINKENLKSAEEDLRLAEERYKLGSGTLLEVIDAQVALTRARATYVSSMYDALIARTQLEAAMGRLGR